MEIFVISHYPVTCDSAAAMSGIFKGKLEGIDGSLPCSSVQESDDEVFSCDSAASVDSVNPSTSNHFTECDSEMKALETLRFCNCLNTGKPKTEGQIHALQ
ncbi:hypothetical protein MG293_004407 [Ovis ammon polii]|uniref:Uncharacterized protein n=1 Tax=Ovis ammon polii TaxID=230172 RepID=A0AAD4UFD4_OVIAM|nr:hypothetical protein MG293_004407 [Ovis ammon polii]